MPMIPHSSLVAGGAARLRSHRLGTLLTAGATVRIQDNPLLSFFPEVPVETGIADLAMWVGSQRGGDQVAQATTELEARGLIR